MTPGEPRFSVLTTVCDPPLDVLDDCLASVRDQTFGDFEHVIVDDASESQEVRRLLTATAAADDRVRVHLRGERGGIVAASNDALRAARGDLVALLDHDDMLAAHALEAMDRSFTVDCDLAYSDHDMIRPDGRLADPVYKPDFSPERLRQQNYITHLVVARRSIVEAVGGFRVGFDGSQDHDLLLRVGERARSVVHVPELLYHWRMTSGSVALDPGAKHYAYERGRQAVADHCDRCGIDAEVEFGQHLGTYRIRRRPSDQVRVSILISSAGGSSVVWGRSRPHLATLLDSLVPTGSSAMEIIISRPDDLDDVGDGRVSAVVNHALDESPFGRAVVAAATGDIVVILDEAMLCIEPGSIAELAGLLADQSVGAVGSAQFHADGCVRHGGFTTHGKPADILYGWAGDHGGPGRLMDVTREVSGVDLIASAWRIDDYRTFAGEIARADSGTVGLQLCQRVRAGGRRVLWTPFSSWYRFDMAVGVDEERAIPRPSALVGSEPVDPYYNVNLQEDRGDWLERPGRALAPPSVIDREGVRRWA
jgi:Glycosyl transferase family 2